MTAKEYLSQAYRLDQRIDSNIAEITRLRHLVPVVGGESSNLPPHGRTLRAVPGKDHGP